jgi:hypothetical protein
LLRVLRQCRLRSRESPSDEIRGKDPIKREPTAGILHYLLAGRNFRGGSRADRRGMLFVRAMVSAHLVQPPPAIALSPVLGLMVQNT